MQKKIFIVSVSFLLCSVLVLNAQVTVNFGAKAGANFSTFLGEDAPNASALTGPHVGGLANISFGGDEGFITYAIQPEIFYSMQGAKSNSEKTTLSYINLPIMVQRYIASSGFYIETGPQIGFLISAKQEIGGVKTDIKDQTKSIDFSLIVGLGYKFYSGLGINARYGLGITSVSSNSSDIRNAGISAGLFYVFGSRE
jgi:hypothetical protein